MAHYLEPDGTLIDVASLRAPKAVQLAEALSRNGIPYAQFIEARSNEDGDIIVFDVEVERPGKLINSINRRERIAVLFHHIDEFMPEVLALRSDFPPVLHTNLRTEELPRSLCLYEERYRSLKRRWTPARFVQRIREWLAETAKGTLHQEDQPLEPFLMDTDGHVFFSPIEKSTKPLALFHFDEKRQDPAIQTLMLELYCKKQMHGLRRRPQTLADLANLTAGIDLVAKLRQELIQANRRDPSSLDRNLILIVHFPRMRHPGGPAETENYIFQTRERADVGTKPMLIRRLGESLGIWEMRGGSIGVLLTPDDSRRGDDVFLDVLNRMYDIDCRSLALLNGMEWVSAQPKICAIGVGAIGSQVVVNLARAGFGRWTLLDDDHLLPHNLARHVLPRYWLWQNKAFAVADFANSMADEEKPFLHIPANVLTPGEHAAAVQSALIDADVILDMSASVSVARHLSFNSNFSGRRISVYVSPTGKDLIILAEDRQRAIRLDSLEMQYYRSCIREEALKGHLSKPERHRYGQSCRDLTLRIPQYLFSIHSGIAAKAIQDILAEDAAKICVWRSHEDGSVSNFRAEPTRTLEIPIGEWTIVTDAVFLDRLRSQRRSKLPNETGGVLLGSFEMERHLIYLVDSIPSPPDSEERRDCYVRGKEGLSEEIARVNLLTDGMIEYVGEWHSHPSGASTTPSDLDLDLFSWLTGTMNEEGLPALMPIIGDGGVDFYLGAIETHQLVNEE